MTRLGIVTGLAFEARWLARAAAGVPSDRRPLITCAPGQARAQAAAGGLAAAGVAGLLSFGVCGALDPALRAGRVVVADAVVGEAVRLATDAPWRRALLERLAGGPPPSVGAIAAAASAVAAVDAKAALASRTGALAVDTESLGVGRAAAAAGLPFLALRAVVDDSRQRLPAAALAATGADGAIRPAALLAALARRPGELADLLRLARAAAAARRSLGDAAACGLPLFGLGSGV